MTSAEFRWNSLLHTDAPAECSLRRALFTTYDRPDERFFVENLVPVFLKLTRVPDGEGKERQYFLLELDRRLKQLRDRLVVVSSTAREERTEAVEEESGVYGWVWKFIRNLTVGCRGNAIQHAKLWLLHWGAANDDGEEHVEIVVSSANLTRAAFSGQLQAAWRACLRLSPRGSKDRLASWGVLPDFLRELFASTNDNERLTPYLDLLSRADCPEGVTFVASVPGTHSRQVLRNTPWGAAGLREITPSGHGTVSVAVLSPYVGSWNADAISRWCSRFEGSTNRLKLIWIADHHPWATHRRWILPASTFRALTGAGASLVQLHHEQRDVDNITPFHKEHRPADDRWSHAKVYLLRRGTSRRLLVTSANFSPSAWGRENADNDLIVDNFELGVCVAQATWPFDELDTFGDEDHPATVSRLPIQVTTLISWAQAIWNGERITVCCRCAAHKNLAGTIKRGSEWTPIMNWQLGTDGHLRSAEISWPDAKQPPTFVQLTCEQETMRVPVFDQRPHDGGEDYVPPEVDEDADHEMRDLLLFEQYGGSVAADDFGGEETRDADEGEEQTVGGVQETAVAATPDETETGVVATSAAEEREEETEHHPMDSYAVPAFDLARRHLKIVDNWAAQVLRAAKRRSEKFELEVLRHDGLKLTEAFERQSRRDLRNGEEWAIGAKLAAEELSLRLKHFPEE